MGPEAVGATNSVPYARNIPEGFRAPRDGLLGPSRPGVFFR